MRLWKRSRIRNLHLFLYSPSKTTRPQLGNTPWTRRLRSPRDPPRQKRLWAQPYRNLDRGVWATSLSQRQPRQCSRQTRLLKRPPLPHTRIRSRPQRLPHHQCHTPPFSPHFQASMLKDRRQTTMQARTSLSTIILRTSPSLLTGTSL